MHNNQYSTSESQTQPCCKRLSGPSWRRCVSRSFHAHVDWKNHPAEILPEKQPKGSHCPFCCDSSCARSMSRLKVNQNRHYGHTEEHRGWPSFAFMLSNDEQQRESNNQHTLFMGKQRTKSG